MHMPVIWEKAVTDGGSLFWSKASWIRKKIVEWREFPHLCGAFDDR